MSRFARRSVGFTLTMLALLPMASGCTPEGSGAYKGPYEREVNLAIPAIEKSAGFPFKRMPKVETRSKDDVRGFLERKFDESTPALELAGTERAYKILGLLPDSLDLRKFMLKLLAEQVLGYYDPATKVLYVVEGADTKDGGELLRVTISHELVHALQDQYANLDSLDKLRGDNDRQTAMQAVNAGLSGETSAGALRRTDWLLKQTADLVIIEAGANDGLRGLDPDSTAANLRAIIAKVRTALPAARMLLVQMEAPTNLGARYTKEFHALYPRVAREARIPLSPFLLDGVAGVRALNQGDGIHPLPEGARRAARTMWPSIRSALEGR